MKWGQMIFFFFFLTLPMKVICNQATTLDVLQDSRLAVSGIDGTLYLGTIGFPDDSEHYLCQLSRELAENM
jgi:hypothetical protein